MNKELIRYLDGGVKKGEYIIGTIGNKGKGENEFSVSPNPVLHTSYSGKKEVERLAKENPGVRFVLLEVKGIARANTVVWE